jgi:hypothetical protein
VVSELGVTLSEPLVLLPPLQPPEAVQLAASVVVQVSVEASPDGMLLGVADKLTVGAGTAALTVTVALSDALPVTFVHVSV